MAFRQNSPILKFENSPAESFMSTSETYPSLFGASSPSASNTMNPMDIMTPQSFTEEKLVPTMSLSPAPESESKSKGSEKKPTKKRKSWGQVLPEPKTNLPPRKRAKTDDEKEQRRVERVLRNRRAAQSSRERKRLEVEALEQRNKDLVQQLLDMQRQNTALVQKLEAFQKAGVMPRSTSPLDSLSDNPVTLSQELFSSHDGHKHPASANSAIVDDFVIPTATQNTLNPASLSPELGPVPESPEREVTPEKASTETQAVDLTSAASPDVAQHSAEMLCDLQCHMSAELPKSFLASQTSMPPILALSLPLAMMVNLALEMIGFCDRPLMQIAMSCKAGFSLLPTPQLLTTILALVTRTSTSTSTSTTTAETLSPRNIFQRTNISPQQTTVSTPRSTTLRIKTLRKILSSSPFLARPLMDATMVALRLVTEGCDNRVEITGTGSHGPRGNDSELTRCLRGIDLPSKELLITLLWTLMVHDKRRMDALERRGHAVLAPENNGARQDKHQPTQLYNLKRKEGKRKLADISGVSSKRSRLS